MEPEAGFDPALAPYQGASLPLTYSGGAPTRIRAGLYRLQGGRVAAYTLRARLVPREGNAPSLSAYETALLLLKYLGKWRRAAVSIRCRFRGNLLSKQAQEPSCLTLRGRGRT